MDTKEPDIHVNYQCDICREIMIRPHHSSHCGHTFCIICIEKLLKKLCPYCRKPISAIYKNHKLDEIIKQQYPTQYETRYKEYFKTTDEGRLLLLKDKYPSLNYEIYTRSFAVVSPNDMLKILERIDNIYEIGIEKIRAEDISYFPSDKSGSVSFVVVTKHAPFSVGMSENCNAASPHIKMGDYHWHITLK